jgi:hypothetical protein
MSTPRQKNLMPLSFQPNLPDLLAAAATPSWPALVLPPGAQAQNMMHSAMLPVGQPGLPMCISDPFAPMPMPLPVGAHPDQLTALPCRSNLLREGSGAPGLQFWSQGPPSPSRSTFFELAPSLSAGYFTEAATFVASAIEEEQAPVLSESGASSCAGERQEDDEETEEDEGDVEERNNDRSTQRWCGGWCGGENNVSAEADYIN